MKLTAKQIGNWLRSNNPEEGETRRSMVMGCFLAELADSCVGSATVSDYSQDVLDAVELINRLVEA